MSIKTPVNDNKNRQSELLGNQQTFLDIYITKMLDSLDLQKKVQDF